jgi:hypothetical protein
MPETPEIFSAGRARAHLRQLVIAALLTVIVVARIGLRPLMIHLGLSLFAQLLRGGVSALGISLRVTRRSLSVSGVR